MIFSAGYCNDVSDASAPVKQPDETIPATLTRFTRLREPAAIVNFSRTLEVNEQTELGGSTEKC